ncbi:MAG: peptidoglycan DD-metalloendopeptidase family protein [Elusimicrobiota bacterium]
MISRIKRIFSHRFTFMIVSHGANKPIQINFHFSVFLTLFALWTGVTIWGSYLSAQHVDYWRTQISNRVLQMKIQYLVSEINTSRQYLDEVKQVDQELRQILKFQKEVGTGGPTILDQKEINQTLRHRSSHFSWEQLVNTSDSFKKETQTRLSSYEELSKLIETKQRMYRAKPTNWPSRGHLTSHYGNRMSPFGGGSEFHPGIDISGSLGTPVRATADGTVQLSEWKSGYGNLVVINHEFGYSTRFGHNSRLIVKTGDKVKRGQTIALMGSTGRSSGVHCHYEVWKNNVRLDPMPYLKASDLEKKAILALEKAEDSGLVKSPQQPTPINIFSFIIDRLKIAKTLIESSEDFL